MVPMDNDSGSSNYPDELHQGEESYADNSMQATLPVAITFCHRRGRTVIYKSVIAALGNPDYIRMLINPEDKVVIVQACNQQERNAIEVPHNLRKDGVSFGINSVALVESMSKLMGWSKLLTYKVKGKFHTNPGFVVFLLNDAEIVNEVDGGDVDES